MVVLFPPFPLTRERGQEQCAGFGRLDRQNAWHAPKCMHLRQATADISGNIKGTVSGNNSDKMRHFSGKQLGLFW